MDENPTKPEIHELIEKNKKEELVKRWYENPEAGHLKGKWELTYDQMNYLMGLIKSLVNEEKKNTKLKENHLDEINFHIEEMNKSEREMEQAKSDKNDAYNKLKEILNNIVYSNIPRRVIQQIIDSVEVDQNIEISTGEYTDKLPPSAWKDSARITSAGSIVNAGEQIVLDREYSLGIDGAFTEFGELVIAWDHFESADSCRGFGNDYSLTISLCDGSSEGDISSKIFSRLLTIILTEMVPLTTKSIRLLFDTPMIKFIQERVRPFNEKKHRIFGRILRDFSFRDGNEAVNGLGSAGATAINVIIHRTGFCWSNGVGDSALYLIKENEDIKPLILDSNLETDTTNLIRLKRKSAVGNGETILLEEGDVLVGVTDHIAEYIEHDRDNLKNLVSNFKKSNITRKHEYWQEIFDDISAHHTKNDDMTIFIYVHDSKNILFETTKYGFSNGKYIFEDSEYVEFEKEYYYNKIDKKGIKRIKNHGIASNLRIIEDRLSNSVWHDFIPKYKIKKTSDEYILVMEHLGEEYIRLDKLIEESDLAGLENVIAILDNIEMVMKENEISHGDFSPSNIMIHKKSFKFKLIDLNTLFIHGCIPHDELGHKGLFGDESIPCIPSIYTHLFPLRALKISIEIMISMLKNQEAEIGRECFNISNDEEYLLEKGDLKNYFLSKEDDLDLHVNNLKAKFPNIDVEQIKLQLSKLRLSEIYNFNSWGNL